jgi:hypothetical protein
MPQIGWRWLILRYQHQAALGAQEAAGLADGDLHVVLATVWVAGLASGRLAQQTSRSIAIDDRLGCTCQRELIEPSTLFDLPMTHYDLQSCFFNMKYPDLVRHK